MVQASTTIVSPWSAAFTPPEPLTTEHVRLEPLSPRHVELDYAALMSCRERLRRLLPWGDWPRDDFTIEANLADLERHWGEFQRREAFAYTVLEPTGSRCLGCVYLAALERGDGSRQPRHATLMYWVTDDALAENLDAHLLEAVLAWLDTAWPLDAVSFLPHVRDQRSIELAMGLAGDLGLEEQPSPLPECRMFVRTRDTARRRRPRSSSQR